MSKAFLKFLILALISLSGIPPSFAHTPLTDLTFQFISFPPDFKDRSITCIARDEKGFIWFATNNNLYRHNGFSIDIVYNEQGESFNNIDKIIDDSHYIWIGRQNEIFRLDLRFWTFSSYSMQPYESITGCDNRITVLTPHPEGGIIAGYATNQIFHIQEGRIRHILDLSLLCHSNHRKAKVNHLTFTGEHMKITTSHMGMIITAEKSGEKYRVINTFQNSIFKGYPINDIIYDHEGHSLVNLGDENLYYVDNNESHYLTFPLDPGITCGTLFLLNDTLAVAISPNGFIYSFDFNSKKLLREPDIYGLPLKNKLLYNGKPHDHAHMTIYETGAERGIAIINTDKKIFRPDFSNLTSHNSLRGIYKDPLYGLFIGTYGEGFIKADPVNMRKTVIHPSLYPYDILPWHTDSLLIAAEGLGLFWYDKPGNKLTKLFEDFSIKNRTHITRLHQLDDSLALIACIEGLYVMDVYHVKEIELVSGDFYKREINTKVYDFKIINDKIWIATESRLYCYSYSFNDSEFIIREKLYTSPIAAPFTSVHIHKGRVYATTKEKGIYIIDTAGYRTIRHYTMDNKLLSDIVYSLVVHDDLLFAGTSAGLTAINELTNEVRNFTVGNGIPDNEFNINSVRRDGDDIYMGTLSGGIKFRAEDIFHIPKPSSDLELSYIIRKNKSGKEDKDRSIPYKDKEDITIKSDVILFSLHFGKRNWHEYSSSESYYFRLSEQTPWNKMPGNKEILFAGIHPGTYQLQIAVLKPDQSINKVVYENTIIVDTPFVQSAWFYLILFLIGSCIPLIILKIKKSQDNKEKNIRSRIAEDLHDEVGGILTNLTIQADHWQYVEETKKRDYAERIAKTGREAVTSMQDIVWGMSDQNRSGMSLFIKINEYISNIQDLSAMSIHLHIDDLKDISLNSEEKINLWLIFKECMTNALKHSEAEHIMISFKGKRSGWQLNIKDNGKGIRPHSGRQGQGLKNLRNRTKRIKADLRIESDKNGTDITISK